MTDSIFQLVEQAQALAGGGTCAAIGHDWRPDGGRPCPHEHPGPLCGGSQTVYRCGRCNEYDYGSPGGPGHDDCVEGCRLDADGSGR